jgi:hypothetical protein
MKRIVAFEIQLGPFAVAQLRVHAELIELTGKAPKTPLRMFVTDTLDNPYIEQEWLPQILGPIAESRRQANEIKKRERIMVVIGNPPYKEKAKGLGGWVEPGNEHSGDPATRRLLVGRGYVEGVPREVWNYEVSGKQVLRQWFSYRKAHRERPIIGDRRPPSKLGDVQPDHWPAEYTTELINVLNVLGLLVALEPSQAALLEQVCCGPLISTEELRAAGALTATPKTKRRNKNNPSPGQRCFLE